METTRRKFISRSLATAAGFIAATEVYAHDRPVIYNEAHAATSRKNAATVRFSVIGLNHGHIYGQTEAMIRNGGQLISFYAKEPDLVSAFSKRFPDAKLVGSEKEILEDESIKLVVSASIPLDRALQREIRE
jgi:hypothetical protein